MNKFELTVLGISIAVTLIFSTLFGFAGSSILGTFWGWFWITLLTQVIGFAIVNSHIGKKEERANQFAELKALEELSKFTIKLSCAYCEQINGVPIVLNQRNTFKCESCNQVNGVSMQFMATTLTTPIDSVTIPVENSQSVEFKIRG